MKLTKNKKAFRHLKRFFSVHKVVFTFANFYYKNNLS